MHCRLKFDIDWPALFWAFAGFPTTQRYVDMAETSLRQHFMSKHIVVGLSARTIFDALLCEQSLTPGAAVLMSGINIRNMGDIVTAHNLHVRVVDVDPGTLAPKARTLLDAQDMTKASISIVAQLFGTVNPLPDASELRKRGVLLIEDAAQAFAGSFHVGSSEADVSLFSFGPIKRRTALGGAIALFKDEKLAAQINRRLQAYPAKSEAWFRRRALKYLVLKALSTPWLYNLAIRIIALSGNDPDTVIGTTARGFSGKELMHAIRYRPPKRMVALMERQISSSPDPAMRHRICSDFLKTLPLNAAPGSNAQDNAYWLFPVYATNPLNLIRRLHAEGFDATRGATSLCALSPKDTANAQALMNGIVYIPNPADLKPRTRSKLQKIVVKVLSETSAR